MERSIEEIRSFCYLIFMENHAKDISNKEVVQGIIDAVQTMSTDIDTSLNIIDRRLTRREVDLSSVKGDLGSVKGDLASVKTDLLSAKGDLSSVKSQMVTKDYLDNKLADLRSDLVIMARKGNKKLEVFIEELVEQKSLTRSAAKRILALEPFPQT